MVDYSPTEKSLLKILLENRDKPWTIQKLTDRHYGKPVSEKALKTNRPWNAETYINKSLNALIKKTRANDEMYLIKRIPQFGRKPDLIYVKAL